MTMKIDKKLLDIIVCPKCKGTVIPFDKNSTLLCRHCKIKYPIRDGIPVMIANEAMDENARLHQHGHGVKLKHVTFRVVKGPDAGMVFHLDDGTFRALGRGGADAEKTSVFNVDLALELDEGTRSLVQRYVSRQFTSAKRTSPSQKEAIGDFRRSPDVVLSDTKLTRLHAMLFSKGPEVGLLDLVSKNGTAVNGEEVESVMLKAGDVIEMGETIIKFEG